MLFKELLQFNITITYQKFSKLLYFVGVGGLEPPTSSVSAKYSNQLSYTPICVDSDGVEPPSQDFQSRA